MNRQIRNGWVSISCYQKSRKLYFEKSICKQLLSVTITPQIHPVIIMAAVWPLEISIVHGLRIQLFLIQTPKYV